MSDRATFTIEVSINSMMAAATTVSVMMTLRDRVQAWREGRGGPAGLSPSRGPRHRRSSRGAARAGGRAGRSITILTGTRWVTLTKLPEALSGGSSAKRAPVAPRAIRPGRGRHAGKAVDREFDRLAGPHLLELRLLVVGDDPDAGVGGDGQQRLPRLDVLPGLDVLVGDLSGHWGDDGRVGALQPGVIEVRPLRSIWPAAASTCAAATATAAAAASAWRSRASCWARATSAAARVSVSWRSVIALVAKSAESRFRSEAVLAAVTAATRSLACATAAAARALVSAGAGGLRGRPRRWRAPAAAEAIFKSNSRGSISISGCPVKTCSLSAMSTRVTKPETRGSTGLMSPSTWASSVSACTRT